MKKIFITGTDTGIGKTVISLLIMRYLFDHGHKPFYLKPFQTGCSDVFAADSDARFIYQYVPRLQDADPSESVVYCNTNPKAPLFAAHDDNMSIDVTEVVNAIDKKNRTCSHMVVEGAGGLLVPVTEHQLIIDIVKQLDIRPLIIARAGLGTINHTLLTINMCYRMDINPLGIIMVNDRPGYTSQEMINENRYAIKQFSGVKVFGVVDHIPDFAGDLSEHYGIIEHCLENL